MSQRVSNDFSGGFSSDIAKSLRKPNTALDLLNFRLSTQKGESTGVLTTPLGNQLMFDIPDTSNVIQILAKTSSNGVFNLVFNGQSSPNISSHFTTVDELYTNIQFAIQNSTNAGFNALNLQCAISSTQVLIWSRLTNNITTTPNILMSVVGNITAITFNTLIDAQLDNKIIGWCYIREKIYIITTNTNSYITAGLGIGQFWELVYDKTTFVATLTLKYNNLINLDVLHPISNPGQIEGRYETTDIQRIYWTDNNNDLRKLNVADVNCFAVEPYNLSVFSIVGFDLPILKQIISGSLPVGAYNLAYILTNTAGGKSISSPVSERIDIINGDLNGSFQDYKDTTLGNSGKGILFTIDNIDTAYNQIELISIFRNTLTTVPTIEIFKTEEISSSSLTFSLTGNETTTPLTLDEFVARSQTFVCKGIVTKDNRLFPFNLKTPNYNPTFDARAFRFPNHSFTTSDGIVVDAANTIVRDNQGNPSDIINLTFGTIPPEKADAINPDLFDNSLTLVGNQVATPLSDNFRYSVGGTRLGGEGINIYYEFGTKCIKADSATTLPSTQIFNTPWRFLLQDNIGSTVVGNHSFPTNGNWNSMKSPYYSGLLMSGMCEEIYRYGIVFTNKNGGKSFVKWIGDIKFPKYDDMCSNPDPLATQFFGVEHENFQPIIGPITGTTTYLQIPYIKFLIKDPQVSPNAQGFPADAVSFEIVVVKREENDKTIVTEGLLSQTVSDGGTFFAGKNGNADINAPTNNISYQQRPDLVKFDSPDWLLNTTTYQPGDKVRLVSLLDTYRSSPLYPVVSAATNSYICNKYYKYLSTLNTVVNISDVTDLTPGQQVGNIISNFTYDNWVLDTGQGCNTSIGAKGTLLHVNSNILFPLGSTINSQYAKYLAWIVRENPSQYGGFSYDDRTSSNYISTNTFINIKDINYAQGFSVFGGDIFNCVMDIQMFQKNWGQTGLPNNVTGNLHTKNSLTYFFPCKSIYNTELREGITTNNTPFKDAYDGTNTTPDGFEEFRINPCFSNYNDTYTYFPLPLNFTPLNEFDCRILASEVKINGDEIDSWGIFKAANYYDVESSYGPLNQMILFQNQGLFWQDKAYGEMFINPVDVQSERNNTNSPSQLILGTGDVLQKHIYKSLNIGCKHMSGVVVGDRVVYFFDVENKKLYDYKYVREVRNFIATPISDSGGISSIMNNSFLGDVQTNDNPYLDRGVTMTYDFKWNDLLFTCRDNYPQSNLLPLGNQFTIAYNTLLGVFSSRYSFTPHVYINDTVNIISPNPASLISNTIPEGDRKCYIHSVGEYNTWYDGKFPSKGSFYVNYSPDVIKVFDNLVSLAETRDSSGNLVPNNFLSSIKCTVSDRTSGTVPIIFGTNLRVKEREFRDFIPRAVDGSRLRDKVLKVDFQYDNPNNYLFILSYIATMIRMSSR